jgi:hypothetical protein
MLLWKIVGRQPRSWAAVGHLFSRSDISPANCFTRSFLSISNATGMTERGKAQTMKEHPTRQFFRFFSLYYPPNTEPNSKKDWNDLSEMEHKHWVCLGWNSTNWLQGPPPESEQKIWADLSSEEKAAARALKLSMLIPRDSALHDPMWAKDSFDGSKHFDGSKKLWHELREADQSNWKVLGWEMSSWNQGHIDPCGICDTLLVGFTHSFFALP